MQELWAGCKANLFLRILGRRKDGLHELQSLFYPLPRPRDRILVSSAKPGTGLQLSCSEPGLQGEGNILCQAFEVFAASTGLRPDLKVHLEKNIPMGAGLGGGSSDAARLLLFLRDLFLEQTGKDIELAPLAQSLGADVSFFLQAGPAWVQGAGEIVSPLDIELSRVSMLVVWPGISISTAQAYALWDSSAGEGLEHPVRFWGLTSNKREYTNFLPASGRLLWNNFEQVLFDRYPELGYIKMNLLARGAAAAVLSGSGSALLALFPSGKGLESVCEFLDTERIKFFI
ncbi:MAG: 4-(cytidine 5'-diphospho)-2-C-methyl-D-erythritol kinase [Desulfohalobiaceae bacterium]